MLAAISHLKNISSTLISRQLASALLVAAIMSSLDAQDLSWSETDHDTEFPVHCLLATEKMLLSGSIGGGLCLSEDGHHWARNESFPGYSITDLMQDERGVVYAATQGYGIYVSEDYGSSWHAMNEGLQGENVNCLADLTNTIACGTNNGVFLWNREEAVWKAAELPIYDIVTGHIISIAGTRDTIFAGGPGTLLYTIDGGEKWLSTGDFRYDVQSLLWHHNSLTTGTSGDGIFRSLDVAETEVEQEQLATAIDIGAGESSENASSVWRLRLIREDVYRLTTSDGVNNGQVRLNEGLQKMDVRDIALFDGKLVLATAGEGVLISDYPNDLLGSSDIGKAALNDPTLKVFPTVTSGEVNFSLSALDRDAEVHLAVMDSSGKIRLKSSYSVKGTYLADNIDISGLENGSYWILVTNGNYQSQQLIVLNR